MGTRCAAQVEQKVRSVEKALPPQDVLDALRENADPVPFWPFEEPFVPPFAREYQRPSIGRWDR